MELIYIIAIGVFWVLWQGLRSHWSSQEAIEWYNKGIALVESNRYEEAIECYDKAIEINAEDADVWYNKGVALDGLYRDEEARECYDNAIECYDKLIEIDPEDATEWNNKGVALVGLNRNEEAIECFDKLIELGSEDADAWRKKGRALALLNRDEEAIECYDKAIEINPKDDVAWYNKGSALQKLGKYDEAIDCYDKAIEINPENADAWKNKGDALYKLGKSDEAIECFDKAIEINPENADVWNNKGFALMFLGKSDEAIECYDEAIEINPEDAHAWTYKGLALLFLGKFDEVIECYDKVIEINPEDAAAWKHKGSALDNLGKSDEAIECYDKAIEINPEDAVAWYNKGLALDELKRYDEAIKHYDKAIEVDPKCEEAIKEREIVKEKLRQQVATKPRTTAKRAFIEKKEVEPKRNVDSLEILRGYSVLPNNEIKFGIRVINNTNFVIIDAGVILDYSKNLFSTKDSELQHLGNIMLGNARTATYFLKPLGCIHNEQINALITYKDHTGKKQTLHMRPKEVHCVCPFLKEKPMSEGEYSRLAANSEFVQEGISFKGISIDELAKFMGETCRHMLYKIKEYDLNGKKVIYLSGESIGEKAYYLLTVVIQDYKGLTQVVLRAHSDKKYGLNGFMNEMADSIRHLVSSVQSAKEIGIIENTQVINIIDSVVQRTSFNMDEGGKAQVNIRESMMQRSNIGAGAMKKCPNCGREVEANEKFCLECGTKL